MFTMESYHTSKKKRKLPVNYTLQSDKRPNDSSTGYKYKYQMHVQATELTNLALGTV